MVLSFLINLNNNISLDPQNRLQTVVKLRLRFSICIILFMNLKKCFNKNRIMKLLVDVLYANNDGASL